MRILVIRNEPPWPLCYGGRLHCFELCRRLAQRHELLLAASRPCEIPDPPLPFACRVLCSNHERDSRPAAGRPLQAGRWERFFGIDMAQVQRTLGLAGQWSPDVVIGMNYQSLSCLGRLRGVPTICDLQDDEVLHNLLELRRGRMQPRSQTLKGLIAAWGHERHWLRRVSAVCVNAEADRRFCRWVSGHRRVVVLAHGVDCQHYAPRPEALDDNRIIFWGSLGFGPNVAALLFFTERVWPRLRRRRPNLRFTIVGRGGCAALDGLRDLPGIDWVGPVPDVRPYAAQAAVVVVPMRTGAGVKNKVLEAWAMGKAVVCTPRAVGDLPGVHGDNLWVGRSPAELASGVLRLLEDAALRDRIGAAGRRTAEQCSWDRGAERLEALCEDLARGGCLLEDL